MVEIAGRTAVRDDALHLIVSSAREYTAGATYKSNARRIVILPINQNFLAMFPSVRLVTAIFLIFCFTWMESFLFGHELARFIDFHRIANLH